RIRAPESSVPGNREQYPQASSECAELSKNRGRQPASGGLDTRSTYSAQYCSLVTEAARALVTDVVRTAGCRGAAEWPPGGRSAARVPGGRWIAEWPESRRAGEWPGCRGAGEWSGCRRPPSRPV